MLHCRFSKVVKYIWLAAVANFTDTYIVIYMVYEIKVAIMHKRTIKKKQNTIACKIASYIATQFM